ncbi:Lrp/AsnC family transcriptional regulator [Marine Group I thaumarchaeote]|jgi:DNA-binding Lrp family transcriptional regulator|uniref:Lrp/AsnC family transcriptional regulator n=1 Tax=Marine Group I thaumarchaeote TaxID=2511932 RepID=A0A7K4MNW9_9ARCH|nr:Lrp/AsnC family transcriptional regulator [Marine Group I thaumarchaeote]NWJ68339.1 Lrp/AsnC family transcriptional regulator [Marine Group I thaumarchaeote]PBO83881.1 MAG: transcriptional regulator [Nitrosopumilales archaeon]RZD32627.1 MAG: transcriptional regulator [Nitrososphaerota archaeon]
MHKDKVDESILEFLRKDSRESFVEIGKKLKLSESAIRHRVKNMVGSGTITKFTVEEGGGQPEALVMVSADSSIDTSKVSLKLTKLNAVKKIYEITGQYDICVIIQAPSIQEINACIDDLRKITGVTDTNTVIILKTIS